jgi:cell division protein FtsN
MANLERDAGEAHNMYAFDPNEEDESDAEASRLPLLIAIALVVLAAFAGVVWLAYTQGVEEGRADAPRVAAADTRSVPAGAPSTPSNPYAGLNIYQPPANSEQAPAAPPSAARAPEMPSSTPALRPSSGSTEKPAPAPQAAEVEPKPPLPLARVAPKLETATAPVPAPAASSAEDSATQAPAAAAAPTSGIMLQIGSYKSDTEARQSWSAFKARHAIAAGFSADVREVDLGARGTWYRLRIGSFADTRAAIVFCEKLKAQGASCIVSR